MHTDALGFCLTLGRAHATLSLRLDERLGVFHGLAFDDFALLHALGQAEGGRMAMADLARTRAMPISALVRKLITLEKLGLAERATDAAAPGLRCAVLRRGGRQLMQEAATTAEAICAQALQPLGSQQLREVNTTLEMLCEAPQDARQRPRSR